MIDAASVAMASRFSDDDFSDDDFGDDDFGDGLAARRDR
jgi:hypothetical protein